MSTKTSIKISPKRKFERTTASAPKSIQHVLTIAEWEAFCKALDRPAKPNRALKEGFRWYRHNAA
jgi:hypothetical protein